MSNIEQYWRGESPLNPHDDEPNRKPSTRWVLAMIIAGVAVVGLIAFLFLGRPSDRTASEASPSQTDPNLPGGTQSAGPAVTPQPGFTATDGPSAALSQGSSNRSSTGGQTVDAYDLQVGDCLLDPGTDPTITKVTRLDCAKPHGYEVFAAFQLPNAPKFPGTEQAQTDADNGCGDRFTTFVGKPVTSSTLSYTFLMPTETTWPSGDRAVTCMIYDPQAHTTGSLKGINR